VRGAALIALLSSGCSMLLVKQPPSQTTPPVYPQCHEESGAIVADILFAVLYGASAISAAGDDSEYQDTTGAVLVSAGLLVLHVGSAALGLRWTSRCKQLHAEWEREHPMEPVRIAPVRHPPPPPAEGALGAACFPNRTCTDGLACGPGQQCVSGDRGLEGLACFDDGSCSADLTCTSAVCIRPPPAECVTDAHCPEGLGLVCQGGFCVSPPAPP
jgi:hypothetical protein